MDYLSFELWLFTFKTLGQTYDASIETYNRLPAEVQEELKNEYKRYTEGK